MRAREEYFTFQEDHEVSISSYSFQHSHGLYLSVIASPGYVILIFSSSNRYLSMLTPSVHAALCLSY